MNGNFLKKVFAQPQFVTDYREFVIEFPELIIEDNEKKIKYLAETIDEYLTAENIKVIRYIPRKLNP